MPKNVDGIKKLSKEELEKSRKLVLDSIGETKTLSEKDADKLSNLSRPVDSVFSKNIKKKEIKKNLVDTVLDSIKPGPAKPVPKQEKNPVKLLRDHGASEKTLERTKEIATDFLRPHDEEKTPKIKKEEEKKNNQKKENNSKQDKIISKINPFKSPVVSEKIKEAEQELKRKEINKKKEEKKKKQEQQEREENKKKLAKEKKKEEKERRKKEKQEEKKKKQENRLEQKKIRQKKLKKLDKKLSDSLRNVIASFKNSLKMVTLISFLGLVVTIMVYTALLIVVIEYKVDNKLLRSVAEYLPMPAYISQDGFISYYAYIDQKNNLGKELKDPNLIEQTVKAKIVENIILDNLLSKYKINITVNAGNIEEVKKVLSTLTIEDQSINQVGLTRINKIKDLIKEDGDFVKIANKYGDLQDKITLSLNNDLENFPQLEKLKDIETGEVSEIINDNGGYYIYRCFDKRNNNLYLSYVYIKGKTLDTYINEVSSKYKLWSLVD